MQEDNKTNTEIVLTNVRLSYPHIFKPKKSEDNDNAKYSARFILDKKEDAKQITKLQTLIEAITKETFKGKNLPADRICLKDGDLSGQEELQGKMFINASNDKRPRTLTPNKVDIVEEHSPFYPGCRVNGKIRLWAQDNKFGKRINASLNIVQFWADDEPYGSGPASIDDMPEAPVDSSDDL